MRPDLCCLKSCARKPRSRPFLHVDIDRFIGEVILVLAMAPHAINGISGHDTHDSNIPYRPTAFDIQDHTIEYTRPLKVVVIGAGLSGVLAGILLPAKCPGIELIIIEKNAEVVSACV